jgi:hypothetical protein
MTKSTADQTCGEEKELNLQNMMTHTVCVISEAHIPARDRELMGLRNGEYPINWIYDPSHCAWVVDLVSFLALNDHGYALEEALNYGFTPDFFKLLVRLRDAGAGRVEIGLDGPLVDGLKVYEPADWAKFHRGDEAFVMRRKPK